MKSSGLSVQVARGKVKSQEGRERREGIEVHVSTGYWLPGELECQRENSRRKCAVTCCWNCPCKKGDRKDKWGVGVASEVSR